MYNFNVVPELLESIKHESEAGKALDPEIALTLKVLLLTLKFQKVANFGVFFSCDANYSLYSCLYTIQIRTHLE